MSTSVLNSETTGPPLPPGFQNVGPSSYKQEFGKFFSGESGQPKKKKELKILTSEVLQLKNSGMLSYRKVHGQQISLGIQSFLFACFSYFTMSRQPRISKHLRIVYEIP